MNQRQLIGTAFEYANISNLSAGMANDLEKLISLMAMYKRPMEEIKQMHAMRLLLTKYHYTYTQTGLEKLISL